MEKKLTVQEKHYIPFANRRIGGNAGNKDANFVACDVNNPFSGQNVQLIYAAQKGATEQMTKGLDEGMENFAS